MDFEYVNKEKILISEYEKINSLLQRTTVAKHLVHHIPPVHQQEVRTYFSYG